MKKVYVFFAFMIALSGTCQAQIIALHSTSGVQIFKGNNALASAYTVAQNADTLYLSGGTFVPPANFDKQLFLYGAGHYVDSTLTTGKTFISGNVILQENADLFHLEGLEITGNLTFNTNQSANNVTVIRCKINGNTDILGDLSNASNNLALINNVFTGSVNLTNAVDVLVTNNIFQHVLVNTYGNQINNNIFLNGTYVSTYCIFTGNNNTLNNNIFIYTSGLTYGTGNVFKKNIFVSTNPAYGLSSTVLASYLNTPQANICVTQTGNAFNYEHNYHLQAPETYLGTDGSEVGIYGGMFPYKEGAVPANPHIRTLEVSSKTNPAGEINVKLSVDAQ